MEQEIIATEVMIRLQIERLPEGVYLATSDDLPGLVAQGRTLAETVEIAQDCARMLVESYIEHGDELPPAFRRQPGDIVQTAIPVALP